MQPVRLRVAQYLPASLPRPLLLLFPLRRLWALWGCTLLGTLQLGRMGRLSVALFSGKPTLRLCLPRARYLDVRAAHVKLVVEGAETAFDLIPPVRARYGVRQVQW